MDGDHVRMQGRLQQAQIVVPLELELVITQLLAGIDLEHDQGRRRVQRLVIYQGDEVEHEARGLSCVDLHDGANGEKRLNVRQLKGVSESSCNGFLGRDSLWMAILGAHDAKRANRLLVIWLSGQLGPICHNVEVLALQIAPLLGAEAPDGLIRYAWITVIIFVVRVIQSQEGSIWTCCILSPVGIIADVKV